MNDFFNNIIIGIFTGMVINLFLSILYSGYCFKRFLLCIINLIKKKARTKKTIFVWNDDGSYISENIISALKYRNPGFYYIALKEPEGILNHWLTKKNTHAIIFIVSDVTKLSNNIRKRKTIQTNILNYVSKGGIFIGTHDIIYRRTNNEMFQASFGCRINRFQTVNTPVKYEINQAYKNHKILEGLPEKFSLKDNEVCWGEWDEVTQKLLVSEESYGKNQQIPLVSLKQYGEGYLLWFNSGDKSEKGMCESIKNPDHNLLKLISNTLNFVE